MPTNLLPSNITPTAFQILLSRYPTHIPPALQDLDSFRYSTLPSTLESRISSNAPHLTKPELEKLISWKLSHGKHRPQLASLVSSNSEAKVKAATGQVFPNEFPPKVPPKWETLKVSLDMFTQLKGIGPASASLILSTFSPITIPFFSDEVYRYLTYESSSKGKGWDRKINYTLKEYKIVVEKIKPLMERLNVAAWEVEKVAYVLGKEKLDLLDPEPWVEGGVALGSDAGEGGDGVEGIADSGDVGPSEGESVQKGKRKAMGKAEGDALSPSATKKRK
ncbi:hypothetical protein HK097_003524 [Rhizophlyctis rosea]|uniref:Uncharacterized protein n=1 Tax=Rhizophlyctis rosea TaxID=64517 RepID=A0AAD5S4S1_9FUNG|nr:hypothetical protein HK097_003524 [Rhizophlyctis rosea]